MLSPDPEQRISIEGIKSHPWVNGPLMHPAALSAEMRRRKDHIDSEKRKEKLANQAKNAVSGNGFIDRDVESTKTLTPPKLIRQEAVINNYNSFRTQVPVTDILCSMATVLREYDAFEHQIAVSEDKCNIVAELSSQTGGIHLVAQVYEDEDAFTIVVTREKGDKISFRKLFELLEHDLTNSETPRQSTLTKEEIHLFHEQQASDASIYE